MCDSCGCGLTPGKDRLLAQDPSTRSESHRNSEPILKSLLAENDRLAEHNRAHLSRYGVTAINLMSSPGAGKTSLLEATIDALSDAYRIAVIEGDLETENDASRIRRRGVPALQIVTGTACHLDAHMVHEALHEIDLEPLDLLFIENVGNLVCPASFDLGQQHNVVLLSVPEGDDKPAKYPVMFRAADLILISKADLLPLMPEFQPAAATTYIRRLANDAPIIELSAKTGAGMNQWVKWLNSQRGGSRDSRQSEEAGLNLQAAEVE